MQLEKIQQEIRNQNLDGWLFSTITFATRWHTGSWDSPLLALPRAAGIT